MIRFILWIDFDKFIFLQQKREIQRNIEREVTADLKIIAIVLELTGIRLI